MKTAVITEVRWKTRPDAHSVAAPEKASQTEMDDLVFLALDPRSPVPLLERLGLILWLGSGTAGIGRTGFWL